MSTKTQNGADKETLSQAIIGLVIIGLIIYGLFAAHDYRQKQLAESRAVEVRKLPPVPISDSQLRDKEFRR